MPRKATRIQKVCKVCGEPFEVLPSRAKKRFCSKSCAAKVNRKTKNPVFVKCQQCGVEFQVPPSRRDAKFCSKECYGESKKGIVPDVKGKHWWNSEPVTLECEQCHAPFQVPESRKGTARFCTKTCADLWRVGRDRPEMKRQVQVTCEQCGKTFSINAAQTERRFCSRGCRALWLGELQAGQDHPGYNSEERACLQCGKPIQVTKGYREKGWGQFCNRQCQALYQVGANSPAWKGGLSFEPYPPEFNDRLKRPVWARDRGICRCGCGQPGADVHHVDYDKENNSLGNLVLLAKSCHGKTNFNREHWTAFFQAQQEGLSNAIPKRARRKAQQPGQV